MITRLSLGRILGIGLAAALSSANATEVLFNLDARATSDGPFPSNRFTVSDHSQNTGMRVNLPKPGDCAVRVSECADIEVLNELDGFNIQPRLSIPFSGPIDVTTVNSRSVFLIPLGSDSGRRRNEQEDDDDAEEGEPHARSHPVQSIGINQIVWDVATNTLHAESDELLEQHARYALIVTRGVRDRAGSPVEASTAFKDLISGRVGDRGLRTYRKALLKGLARAGGAGVQRTDIVAASVFTTQSITAILEKIRDQIKAATPAPADFALGGPARTKRTVFALGDITSISSQGEVRTAPPGDFVSVPIRLALLRPGTVGTLAFGSYRSSVYLNQGRFIPQVGTRTGVPAVQAEDEVFFTLFLPAAANRPRPASGWPVVIFGPGCCADDHKNGTPFNIASTLAEHGIATISINAAGQGRGPRSTLTVAAAGQTVTLTAGGRSIDINGDGAIGPGEGTVTPAPRRLVYSRDARVQTIADLLQLVRVIEVGMDVDGDGQADLDPSRISYFGYSAGAMRGPAFVAVEPKVRTAALAVVGGGLSDAMRLAPGGNRAEVGELLLERTPPLLNAPGVTKIDGVAAAVPHFNENMPLRNGVSLDVQLADNSSHTIRSPVVNTVQGAMEIQEMLERMEWVNMPADAAAFARYLKRAPLSEATVRPVLVLFAKGDQTVPNPATSAVLRAGDLADVATYYRTDLAVNAYGPGPGAPPPTPPPGVEKNGHNFLVRMNSSTRTGIARAAQEQVARFLASDGAVLIDPDTHPDTVGLLAPPQPPLFETPIGSPLPEDLSFIP